jgi:ABC-type Na+ efflux pump permease subunit
VDPAVAVALLAPTVRYTPLTEEGKLGSPAQALAPFISMLMLYMGVVGISQMLVSSTIEEKASRVYEVLLSSVSPLQLMAGKMLAICAVGLTLMLVWAGGGLLTASVQGVGSMVGGTQVLLFLAYYLLGFLMFASLMVMVGSACNTLKEAQNMMSPLSMVLALPLLLSFLVLRDPNGTAATVLSFVPPLTPFLMMARVASVPGPPAGEVLASLLLLAGCTVLALRVAARVFRVGILMVGQPATLRQLWHWMRTP